VYYHELCSLIRFRRGDPPVDRYQILKNTNYK